MKIKYLGKRLKTAFIPGIGTVHKDEIYDVSDTLGKAYTESGDFVLATTAVPKKTPVLPPEEAKKE